jgi:hypothetical protein
MIAFLGAGEEYPYGSRTPAESIRAFQSSCAQCLVLSKYTQPGPYTIEALMLYMESSFLFSANDQVSCFLLVGSVVRLALRIGLHRDPSKIRGAFTPYQGELRRRVWHMLAQIDLLSGFHIGLPSITQGVDTDTEYPRNIKDEDFDEDSLELPPSKPETDMTPVSYMICKGRISHAFGKILAQANRLSLPSYEETMELDRGLNEAFAQVPLYLRYVPGGPAVTDSSKIIMQRFNIALLYYKSLCVLHRKFLIKEREHPEYAYSKRVGLAASMQILFYHSEIYEAIQPGGPLGHDTWYISSLPMHDFLLAATIVSIKVMQMIEETRRYPNCENHSERTQQEMITALEKSYNIGNKTKLVSAHEKKAASVIGCLLRKIKSAIQGDAGSDHTQNVNTHSAYSSEPSMDFISDLSMNGMYSMCELPYLTLHGQLDPNGPGDGRFKRIAN